MNFFAPSPAKRVAFFLISDTILIAFSLWIAYLFRFGFVIPHEMYEGFFKALALVLPLKIVALYISNIYKVAWRFMSIYEAFKILKALFASTLIFLVIFFFVMEEGFPRSVVLIDFFVSAVLIGGMRFSKRLWMERKKKNFTNKTIIIGANEKASSIVKSFLNGDIDYYPIAILSEKKRMVGTLLANIKVYAMEDMEKIIKNENIKSAIIAKHYEPKALDELFEKLKAFGIKNIKIVKLLGDKEDGLKDISIEDLLARKPKDLDSSAVQEFIQNKTVLITGAGGSIGSELAKLSARFGAKKLVLVDNSEYNLYQIAEYFSGLHVEVETIMQSVVNRDEVFSTIAKHKPHVVLHAAAYKHVPLVEKNISQAILNNIMGTKNCIDASIQNGVQKFVLISTDKAVRPTNVMGATKRVCEIYAMNVDAKDTEISAVRFGNVLGSSGSVIPKFQQLIAQNRPLSVTHPEITRYFMLIPEACQLVLQSATIAKGKELFVLDMGRPVKIVDLARKMLKLYDKEELGIEFTGLRQGEKLFEELLIDEDDIQTKYSSIFVTSTKPYDISLLESQIEELLVSSNPLKSLKDIVPEFNHNKN
ncbi:MAG: nucleoside-diphosphate sugar epimerase/dehydratase [Sulfurospirillaceae bacterium]|nr:nucleoside-diphosphate sugar epimerase/dehydratase [Sulfurospirillaceae bacterium]